MTAGPLLDTPDRNASPHRASGFPRFPRRYTRGSNMTRIAIVGGGPGGLMTAHLLERRFGASCRVTLLEASHRWAARFRPADSQPHPCCTRPEWPNVTPMTGSVAIRCGS